MNLNTFYIHFCTSGILSWISLSFLLPIFPTLFFWIFLSIFKKKFFRRSVLPPFQNCWKRGFLVFFLFVYLERSLKEGAGSSRFQVVLALVRRQAIPWWPLKRFPRFLSLLLMINFHIINHCNILKSDYIVISLLFQTWNFTS